MPSEDKTNADTAFGDPSFDERGQPANLAAQSQLGLLSQRRSRSDRNRSHRIVASRTDLKCSRKPEAILSSK